MEVTEERGKCGRCPCTSRPLRMRRLRELSLVHTSNILRLLPGLILIPQWIRFASPECFFRWFWTSCLGWVVFPWAISVLDLMLLVAPIPNTSTVTFFHLHTCIVVYTTTILVYHLCIRICNSLIKLMTLWMAQLLYQHMMTWRVTMTSWWTSRRKSMNVREEPADDHWYQEKSWQDAVWGWEWDTRVFGHWKQLSANDSYGWLWLSVSSSFTLFIQHHYQLGNGYTPGIQLPQAIVLSSRVIWWLFVNRP